MQIIKNKVERDIQRDNFWTQIQIKSPTINKKTSLIVCASYEYLGDKLKKKDLDNASVEKWVDDIILKWQSKGNSIFNEPVHKEVWAITDEGKKNGEIFISEKINSKTISF